MVVSWAPPAGGARAKPVFDLKDRGPAGVIGSLGRTLRTTPHKGCPKAGPRPARAGKREGPVRVQVLARRRGLGGVILLALFALALLVTGSPRPKPITKLIEAAPALVKLPVPKGPVDEVVGAYPKAKPHSPPLTRPRWGTAPTTATSVARPVPRTRAERGAAHTFAHLAGINQA